MKISIDATGRATLKIFSPVSWTHEHKSLTPDVTQQLFVTLAQARPGEHAKILRTFWEVN